MRTRRAIATAAAVSALLLAPSLASTAAAGPPADTPPAHAGGHSGGHSSDKGGAGKSPGSGKNAGATAKAVAKQIRAVDRMLAKVADAPRLLALPEDQRATLLASVQADRDALTSLGEAVATGTTTGKQARKSLRGYSPENYRKAVNILRDAADLADVSDGDSAVADLIDHAVTAALSVTATSPRGLVKQARKDLATAWDLDDEGTDDAPDGTDEDED
ncbi:hypothetical protein QI633_09405 [Nocardioides sp. QY071]|uniref:hypothetical protein n=1 Tax=Nocardioides sp. QY071 TaxID=3044187 RepID=UPI00249B72FD|nr:hypothetical protein [Nocardioides sp. QY071]WGY03971.1 hypothetical protein QI633_09405 [Nocardioides sp. QY071]